LEESGEKEDLKATGERAVEEAMVALGRGDGGRRGGEREGENEPGFWDRDIVDDGEKMREKMDMFFPLLVGVRALALLYCLTYFSPCFGAL
jgi:hypothetical protein